jgi:16S rRNA processing protein RimM
LIGCEVFEENGAPVGRVRDVQFTGEGVAGTPLLVLDSARGELLVPLAQEICVRVDTAARRIEVALPEGLRDLNSA